MTDPPPNPPPAPSWRAELQAPGIAAALALATGMLALSLSSSSPPATGKPSPSPVVPRKALAVLGFHNVSGRADLAWVSPALAEMLSAELAAGESVRVVSGESVARLKNDLGLQEADALSPDTLARVRYNLGNDWVVLGSYRPDPQDGSVRVELRVQETEGGRTTATVRDSAATSDLLGLVLRSVDALRRQLGIVPLAESAAGRAAHLAHPEAARLYAEGLARLRAFDVLAARDLLQRAIAAEPDHPLPRAALAEAWAALGYDPKAREEAKRALELAAVLPREEKLWVQARSHEMASEWDLAIDQYRKLWSFFPDNLDYGVRLALAQGTAGHATDARATIQELRRTLPAASDDPRVEMAEARTASQLGEFLRAADAAGRAARKGRQRGARLMVAQARIAEANALQAMGNRAAAVVACEEARAISQEAGDRAGVARALNESANILRYQGNLEEAKKAAAAALVIAREIGDTMSAAFALNRIASVDAELGRLGEALVQYQQTVELWKEVGQRNREITAINNIGETLWKLGRLAEAREHLERAMAAFRRMDDRRGTAFTSRNLGHVRFDAGDLQGARAAYQEALGISREIGFRSVLGEAMFGLAEVSRMAGNAHEALVAHEQALALRQELKEDTRAAESQLALGRLALEAGVPTRADELAATALARFVGERLAPREAVARALLAETRLAEGRDEEARSEAERAQSLVAGSEHRALRLEVALAVARVRAARDGQAGLAEGLRRVAQEAHQAGLRLLDLRARIQLARLDSRAEGAEAVKRLALEAQAAGFGLLAREATTN